MREREIARVGEEQRERERILSMFHLSSLEPDDVGLELTRRGDHDLSQTKGRMLHRLSSPGTPRFYFKCNL